MLKCGFSVIKLRKCVGKLLGCKIGKQCNTVKEIKKPNGYCSKTDYVIRQTSVSLPPYKVIFEVCNFQRNNLCFIIYLYFIKILAQLNPTRNVIYCSCHCAAGTGCKCKHIAAVVYCINNEEALSKTITEQEWRKPSKSGEAKFKKKERLPMLYFQKGVQF